MFLHRFGKSSAPDFSPGLRWLNSSPLTLKSLRGKVVLLDFWAYSCLNCLHTLPKVKEWYKIYNKKGLMVIGIHTPEFSFEKKVDNVKKAIQRLGIDYPVVLDNSYKMWRLYNNKWWPRKFLIDKKGNIVYDHIGEGGYAETEGAIQKALMEIGAKGLPPIAPDLSVGGGICYRTTPEIYLGFLRGAFANVGTYIPGAESDFVDDNKEYEEDVVYLHGHWKVGKESLAHVKKLPYANEYLLIKYSAFSVNLIAGSLNGKTAEIELELDEQPLPEDIMGEDVKIVSGKAVVKIKDYRLYKIIDSDAYHQGRLKIKTKSGNLEIFNLTFGGCKGL
ncbi:thioredoxin family protein [Candidatus Parcubacteria bacterium]|nr:MAG: thioredoxin family protein [Candidatus Parcubacteria bacterium]